MFLIETDTFDDGNPEEMANILTEMKIQWSYIKYVPIAREIKFVKPSKRYHKLAYWTKNRCTKIREV